VFLVFFLLVLSLIGFGLQALAQPGDDTWATPVNLSQSGAASDSVILPLPDGSLRVFWWDQFDGTMVADGVLWAPAIDETGDGATAGESTTPTLTSDFWSAPKLATIRIPETVRRDGQEVVVLTPIETVPKIVGDTSGRAHAFWRSEPDEDTEAISLLYSRLDPGSTSWSTPGTLAGFAGAFAVTSDISGTLHLAYVQSQPAQNLPVGLYYRQLPLGGGRWSAPAAIHSSRYSRLLSPEEDHLRMTADNAGNVYTAWDDPHQGLVLVAHSADGGVTWNEPEPFIDSGVQPEQDRVIALPGSAPTVLWAPADAPHRRIAVSSAGNALKLTAWDGEHWSATRRHLLRFEDPELSGQVRLIDPHLLLLPPSSSDEDAIETLVVVGTDSNRDLWITGSKVDAVEQLLDAPAVVEGAGETEEPVPVNLSQSGAASEPAIVAQPDGTLHAFWWDEFDGLTVADGFVMASSAVSGTEEITTFREVWAEPRSVPILLPETVMEGAEDIVVYTPIETMPRIVADATGGIHAFWLTEPDERAAADEAVVLRPLMHSRLEADETAWTSPVILSGSVASFDVATDASGTLHLAYIQPLFTPYSPAGVYYRRLEQGATGWAAAIPLQQSRYFRSLSPQTAHLRLATEPEGGIYITWDYPHQELLMLAYSPDGGTTWQGPTTVVNSEDSSLRGRLIAVPGSETMLMWEETDPGGRCTLAQASVNGIVDGVVNTGQLVLEELGTCPENARFLPLGEGQSLMVTGSGSHDLMLAVWDSSAAARQGEGQWSIPSRLSFSFEDPTRMRQIHLGDLQATLVDLPLRTSDGLAGRALLAVGTDGDRDVWVTSSEMATLEFVFSPPPPWSPPVEISGSEAHPDLPAITSDGEGQVHTLWSEIASADTPGSDLLYARRDGKGWSLPAAILQSLEGGVREPSLAAVGDRLQLVWSNQKGEILHSYAFAQEAFVAESMSRPQVLSEPGIASSEPEIVGDAALRLHVIFAVPVNEGRGIYYTVSNDGESWAQPIQIFDAAEEIWTSVGQPLLAVDEFGFLHAIWLRLPLPGSGPPEGVYYARSLDAGESWSEPVSMADGPYGWPQIKVADGGQVHLVWQEVNGLDTWWHRFSSNAGETWTSPEQITAFGNAGGPARLMVDDRGALHLVGLGQDGDGFATLQHAIWDGAQWIRSEEFRLGLVSVESGVSAAVNPTLGQLDVIIRGESQGETEAQAVLWHSGRQVPTVVVTPSPAFVPQPTPTPTATAFPTPTPRPTRSFSDDSQNAGGDTETLLPILLAGAGALLIVGVVIGTKFFLAGRW
jgi:hypothetical protein